MKYVVYYQNAGNISQSTVFANSEEEAKNILKRDIPNASVIKMLESEGHDEEILMSESLNLKNYKVFYHFNGKKASDIVSADTPEKAEKIILSQNGFRTITETSETDEPVSEHKSDNHQTQPVAQPTIVNLSDSNIEKLANAIVSKHSLQNRHDSKKITSINEIDLTFGNIFGIVLKASIAAIPVYLILALIAAILISGIR